MSNVTSMTVGEYDDGDVSVDFADEDGEWVYFSLTIEQAEWLRDRLFRVCASFRGRKPGPVTS